MSARKSSNILQRFISGGNGRRVAMGVFVLVFGVTGYMLLIKSDAVTYQSASPRSEWVWPVPASKRISQKYGLWYKSKKGYHKGIDIPAPVGTTVNAAHSGSVVKSYYSGSCGYFVLIKAESTPYWHAYQHLKSGAISAGTYVKAGQRIGSIGSWPKCTTGPHLHFSVEKGAWISWYSSPLSNSVNPLSVLR